MTDLLKDNAVWLTPALVAVISGVFYLLKKGGTHNRQRIGNVSNGKVNQAGGSITINGKDENNV